MITYRVGIFIRCLTRAPLQFNKTGLNQLRTFSTKSKKEISTLKLSLIGAAIGAGIGTVYSFYNSIADKDDHRIHQQSFPRVLDKLPQIRISKRLVNSKDDSNLDLILFQFQTCPFCCKVRAFLDFLGVSYSVVEVDAVLRQDLKWSTYKKVPMLLARQNDGKYVQLTDSSTIISILASYMLDKSQDIGKIAELYPTVTYFNDSGKKIDDVMNKYFLMYQESNVRNVANSDLQLESKWRNWADSHLVHLISPNVYRTRKEAFETFNWFAEAGEWNELFPSWEKNMMVYVGANVMWLISKRLVQKYKLKDDVRGHIYDALNDWTKELKKRNVKFMGGTEPNLADLTVFGVLSSMEGCRAFKDCLANTDISDWFFDVKKIVQENRGAVVYKRSSA